MKVITHRTPMFGLALSGGALRGAAHVGVLEVLVENGLVPSCVAGTSAGSMVGALFAKGISPQLMREIAVKFPGRQLVDWSFSTWDVLQVLLTLPLRHLGIRRRIAHLLPAGFIRGEEFEKFVRRTLELPTVRSPIPMFIVTTEIRTGIAVVFSDYRPLPPGDQSTRFVPLDDTAAAVRASCSMPGIFAPKRIGSERYMDGAICDNIPVDLLFQTGLRKVIAVDLRPITRETPHHVAFTDVFYRAIDILLDQVSTYRMANCPACVIQPEVPDMPLTSFDQLEACIDAGRRAAQSALPRIREYFSEEDRPLTGQSKPARDKMIASHQLTIGKP